MSPLALLPTGIKTLHQPATNLCKQPILRGQYFIFGALFPPTSGLIHKDILILKHIVEPTKDGLYKQVWTTGSTGTQSNIQNFNTNSHRVCWFSASFIIPQKHRTLRLSTPHPPTLDTAPSDSRR
jgi:hypothetical protein